MRAFLKRTLITLAAMAFWVAVWYLIARQVNQELLVPSPLATGRILWSSLGESSFWKSVLFSLLRVGEGFVLGVVAGCTVATLSFLSPPAGHLFKPLLTVIRATPVASFIVLALVWIKTDKVPVFISFLMVMPILWSNVRQGLLSASPALREVCQIYRFGKVKTIRHLYLPAVRPYFFAALNTSIGLAWKAGIAAEILCRPEFSIGGAIWRAKLTLEMPTVFAWTGVVILLSLVLEELLSALIRRLSGGNGREATPL